MRTLETLGESLPKALKKLQYGKSLDHWDLGIIGDFQSVFSWRTWVGFELPLVVLVP